MKSKYHQQFELSITPTEFSIRRNLMETFKVNRDVLVFDLGGNVSIFKHFVPRDYIEEQNVKPVTENLLLRVANAYKWIEEDLLSNMLTDFADSIRKKSLGGVISAEMYEHYVKKAISLKDTIDVDTNSTIRFLENPYYVIEEGENLKQLRIDLINKQLGNEGKKDNYDVISEEICCYDLNQRRLTKKILSEITNLSYASIKNYLNDYPVLMNAYKQVNRLSGTEKQHKSKIYNWNKISKVAKLCA